MISKEQCVELVLRVIPEFKPYWQEHRAEWDGEEPGLCNDMSAFSHYTWQHLVDDNRSGLLPRIFGVVEKLMVEGDQDVQDAAATCFIENLVNRVSWKNATAPAFRHFLGPKSRDYCKAWDEFTGVRTDA